ncbi:hypothetical protein GFS24_28225 [Chitinophaga sp. SYP-B3965]|uniref:hypothetical protein n=1 Tax=Chitinophaga sp. SYP-B3965 TaxID=2663120 RepID=UPI00129A0841|nr:hypothetical protein [Chitinophaga sp. SYP-B3965]MRG49029.1 hypothetical protein [Chitinophaga sp. SYP-B3965]
MRKIVTYRIIAIVIIVAALLGILMTTTKMPNEEKNGFTRNFLTEELSVMQHALIDPSLNKISGVSEKTIFLAGGTPNAILMLNKNLLPSDTLIVNLNIPADKIVPFSVTIDSPWLYIHINNLRSIIHGKFPNQTLTKTEIEGSIFLKSIQISPSSCIIKTVSTSMNSQILRKVNIETGETIKEIEIGNNSGLSKDWLSSDGMLEYNKSNSKLIYVEYLRNKFYCLDSNLNVLYNSNTIDTVSVNEIKMTKEVERGGKLKMVPSGARKIVNKYCFLDNKNLYVISGLRADNESLKKFNTNTVVDSYNISNGKYRGSFYMKKYENNGIQSALLNNDTLITLSGTNIITYHLENKL